MKKPQIEFLSWIKFVNTCVRFVRPQLIIMQVVKNYSLTRTWCCVHMFLSDKIMLKNHWKLLIQDLLKFWREFLTEYFQLKSMTSYISFLSKDWSQRLYPEILTSFLYLWEPIAGGQFHSQTLHLALLWDGNSCGNIS